MGNNLYFCLCVSVVESNIHHYHRVLTVHNEYSAILDNKIPIELQNHVIPAALNAGLPKSSLTDLFDALALGTPAALAKVPGIDASIEAAVGAAVAKGYSAVYAYVYYAAIAVGLVGLIGTLPLPSVRFAKIELMAIACCCVRDYDQYFTSHVPRQIYKSNQTELPPGKEIDEATHTEDVGKQA